ncbi:MAG: HD domain-containing protein, partial [Eubacteriales bacterium]|nr:HD domain-containing protein [Eubacteriales bacterium]
MDRIQSNQAAGDLGKHVQIDDHFAPIACSNVVRTLEMIQACNLEIVSAKDEVNLIQNICNKIVDVGGYRFVWYGHIVDNPQLSVRPTAIAGQDEGYLDAIEIALNDPLLNIGPSGQALLKRHAFVCQNIATDPSFAPWRDQALKSGFRSSLAIPIISAQDDLFGVMSIYSATAHDFDQNEVDILTQMVQSLSIGITSLRNFKEKLRATESLRSSLIQMKRIMYQTVSSLSKALEFRDPYTASHQRHVTNLAVSLAQYMELHQTQIEEIFIAATLHDIGKMSIPTEILNKPGKISTIEMGIIQNHSQIGYEMVKQIEFPYPIAEIILQHHEKLDGSGYPRGLKGDEILLSARIIGIADSIEAMSSDRPYRPSLGMTAALAEISSQKGKKFDAAIVD